MQNTTGSSLAALALVAALAAPVLPGSAGGRGSAAGETSNPSEARVLREEFFVLETLPADLDPLVPGDLERTHHEAQEVGLVACRRRNDDSGRLLEWDVRFLDSDTRLLHVERETEHGASLVWREWQADRGRTLTLEPLEGGGARLLEWGRERPVRGELEPDFVLPLGLLERLRLGELETGAFRVFDPLAREVELIRIHTRASEPRPRPAVANQAPVAALERRVVELVGPDDRLRGSYVFEGVDLVAFQWQSGHLRARRVDATDYLRRRAAMGAAVEVVEER